VLDPRITITDHRGRRCKLWSGALAPGQANIRRTVWRIGRPKSREEWVGSLLILTIVLGLLLQF
jgi:hypothetical protein